MSSWDFSYKYLNSRLFFIHNFSHIIKILIIKLYNIYNIYSIPKEILKTLKINNDLDLAFKLF